MVVGVVAAAVAQVDPAGEGDVPLRVVRVAQHYELLVVRSAAADPLVQQHLAAGRLDVVAEAAVLLLAVREPVQVRTPEQPLDDHPALGGGREQLRDGGPVVAHPLVRIAAPVGEKEMVPFV